MSQYLDIQQSCTKPKICTLKELWHPKSTYCRVKDYCYRTEKNKTNTWHRFSDRNHFSWIIVCTPNTMTAAPTPILSAFTEAENESSTTLLSNGSEPCSLNESPLISWELDLESWQWLDWVEPVEFSGAPELAWSCGPWESSYSSWCDDEDFGIVFKSAAQKALPATCSCCSMQPSSWHQADFLLQSCRK